MWVKILMIWTWYLKYITGFCKTIQRAFSFYKLTHINSCSQLTDKSHNQSSALIQFVIRRPIESNEALFRRCKKLLIYASWLFTYNHEFYPAPKASMGRLASMEIETFVESRTFRIYLVPKEYLSPLWKRHPKITKKKIKSLEKRNF